MRTLSVSEFMKWQQQKAPREFIFDSDNNPWMSAYCFHTVLRFQSVTLSSTMRRLSFRNTKDSLCLEQIKEVHMFDNLDSIGTVFDLICESTDQQHTRRRYRFLAD